MTETLKPTATLVTPPGRGALTVIILSGNGAEEILPKVFRPLRTHVEAGEDVLRLGHVVNEDKIIDEAIVARHNGAFEINIHGGQVAAKATLERLQHCGATVTSVTPQESFHVAHRRWNNPAIGREMLLVLPHTRSMMGIAAISRQWSAGLSELARDDPTPSQLREAARGYELIRRLLQPANVVLAGQPNVGKSTLANALAGRQISIVHDVPGTTRDWVRELVVLDGVPVYLTDTAGLWKAPDEIDAEAVTRARRCIEEADLVGLLHVGPAPDILKWLDAHNLLRIGAKCDIVPPDHSADVMVSSHTGEGLADLRKAIVERIGLGQFDSSRAMAFTERQAELLLAAANAIEEARPDLSRIALDELLEGNVSALG